MKSSTTSESKVHANAAPENSPPTLSVTLVSINYAPEVTGIAVYSTGLAQYLARAGRRVRAITGFAYYPAWRKSKQDRGVWFRSEVVDAVRICRCYLYVPGRLGVLRRVMHELSFVLSASLYYLCAPRTQVTIIVMPPLFLGIPLALLARMKRSRVLVHVQDLQPDAAVDLGMLSPGRLTRILYALERWTYALAHAVSAIGPAMLSKIADKGVPREKLVVLRNWANDELVHPLAAHDSLRDEWAVAERFVVLYAGNLGVKQGLDQLLEAAHRLREESDIVFLIVGDGGEKAALMESARARALRNVSFHPLQPPHLLSRLLATADVSVIPQRAGVRDIVLPSKLPNLMASARPILVMADPGTELQRMVSESECGRVVSTGDVGGLVEEILRLRASPQARIAHGVNGRAYVLERLSRARVLGDFDRWLEDWVRPPSGLSRTDVA